MSGTPRPRSHNAALDRVATALVAIGRPDGLGRDGGTPAACYVRVSTPEQAAEDKYGVERQVRRFDEVASQKQDWVASNDIYADDVTGTRTDRHGLTDLLSEAALLHERGVRRVYVEEADRLGRGGIRQSGWILYELQRRGLEVVFTNHGQDEIEAALRAWRAREDNERRRVLIRGSYLSKAHAGKVTARTPRFGYRLNRTTWQYEEHEDQAAVVRQIWSWYAEGLSYREIVRRLHGPADAREPLHPSPAGRDWWTLPGVRFILNEEAYATGKLFVNRWVSEYRKKIAMRPREEWLAIPVPVIVPSDVAARVARRLADPQSARWNPRRAVIAEWLLQGLLKCAACGHSFSPKSRKRMSGGEETRLLYYVCAKNYSRASRDHPDRCHAGQISKRIVEERVWTAVLELVRDPHVLEAAGEVRLKAEDLEADYRAAVDRLARVERAWQKLWKEYEDDVIDQATFRRKARDIQTQRRAAERDRDAAARIHSQAGSAEKRRQGIMSRLQALADHDLARLSFMERRRLIGQLFESIAIDTAARTLEFRGPIAGVIPLDTSQHPAETARPGRRNQRAVGPRG